MEVYRRSSWLLLLGVLFLATALQGVQGEAESEGPTESECRPYIEKALKELEAGETEAAPPPGEGDSKEDLPTVEITTDDSDRPQDDGDSDVDGDGKDSTESAETEKAEDVETQEGDEDDNNDDVDEESAEQESFEQGSQEEVAEETQQEDVDTSVEDAPTEDIPAEEVDQEEKDEALDEQTKESAEEVDEGYLQSKEQEQISEEEADKQEQGESEETEKEDEIKESTEDESETITGGEEVEEKEDETEAEESKETESLDAAQEETIKEQEESGEKVEDEIEEAGEETRDEAEEETGESLEEEKAEEPGEETEEEKAEEPEEEAEKEAEEEVGEEAEEEVTGEEEGEEEIIQDETEDNTIEAVESKEEEEEAEPVQESKEDENLSHEVEEEKEDEKDTEPSEDTQEADTSKQEDDQESTEESDKVSIEEEDAEKEEEKSSQEETKGEDSKEDVTDKEGSKEEADIEEPQVDEEEAKKDESEEKAAISTEDQESESETEEVPEGVAEVEELLKESEENLAQLRPRDHIAQLLKLDEESSELEKATNKFSDIILRELKKLYENAIKPLETLYKYRDLSNRHFGDAEIFSKPLILFMGPWSGGKSTIINYLLGIEYNETSLHTGAEPSPAYFNILMYGEEPEILDGTELAADYTFSGLQKFGQGLEERLRGYKLPSKLLEKVNIVEIPGILEVRKQVSRVFPFNDACQWFIDRADIIFLVYDPSKLDVGPETEAILDQLKGREHQTRIVLNKADQVKPEELMRVQGALIWNISPLMSSAQPPIMYTTSLWSKPYEPWAPVRLLQAQERAFLRDLRSAVDKRIDNKIASARRFAVRVRNHAKMVDCYLTTYYNHKSVFGNRKQISDEIINHPQDYHIYEGLSTLTNISRYDLPDPDVYRDFFRLNALYDFQQLASTCTYFRGCPINRLDVAIAYDLPELVGKHKRLVETAVNEATATPGS